ncbi:MAG: polyphosphate polymerase domain-containing protein [Clostridiales bacterium]|nr:polyphosphate polymerase domain-containing protein [Clostridiales bacterium]
MKDGSVFKRYELKFLITEEQMREILWKIRDRMREDEHGRSTILSLYYDTPDHLLITRSMEHPVYKEKLRLRSYGVPKDDDKVYLELKKKYKKEVFKRRITILAKDAATMKDANGNFEIKLPEGSEEDFRKNQIAKEIAYSANSYEGLAPMMLLSYERDAWFCKDDENLRITFDRNVLWRDYDLDLRVGIYGKPIIPGGQVLMEIKVPGGFPLWLTEILSKEKIYKTSFSKYAHAYEAMMQQKTIRNNLKLYSNERSILNNGYDFSRAV